MSYMSRPEALEPETLADIKARHAEGDPGNGCDCDMARHRWLICDYHEGYDDALDQQRRKARQIEQVAAIAFGGTQPPTDTTTPEMGHLRQGGTVALTELWAALDSGTLERNAKDQT